MARSYYWSFAYWQLARKTIRRHKAHGSKRRIFLSGHPQMQAAARPAAARTWQ
jgi:hypothetical protein